MNKKNISLWKAEEVPFYNKEYQTDINEDSMTITPYLLEDGKEHEAILVFPGGGYTHRAEKEAEPVARYFNSLGMHAFVVNYRVVPYDSYLGCVDGKRAIRFLRANTQQFHIAKNCIGVIGFSAGAGIACLAVETYDKEDYEAKDEIDTYNAKPDFCIFSYGSLSIKPDFMSESDVKIFEKLVPVEMQEDFIKKYSCDEQVREDMPPIFLWHTADDVRVKVGAVIEFVQKLQEKNNDYEFHIFPKGGHGTSVTKSSEIEGTCQWLSLMKNWLYRNGFLSN